MTDNHTPPLEAINAGRSIEAKQRGWNRYGTIAGHGCRHGVSHYSVCSRCLELFEAWQKDRTNEAPWYAADSKPKRRRQHRAGGVRG